MLSFGTICLFSSPDFLHPLGKVYNDDILTDYCLSCLQHTHFISSFFVGMLCLKYVLAIL